MSRFCANLTFLFTELPFLERFGAARTAGFDAVEILFPYDVAAGDIRDRLAVNGLTLASINAPPPNYTGGQPGFPAVPGGEERFRHDFRRALRYANALGAERLQIMSGLGSGPAARATYVANLRWAAAQAGDMTLTIEPVNTKDVPGYFLCCHDLARDVLAEVAAPNLRLQFDAYQAHAITGDAAGVWAEVAPLVSHVQIAGPDRAEPDSGMRALLQVIRDSGYDGWIAAEYAPRGPLTTDGLGWMHA